MRIPSPRRDEMGNSFSDNANTGYLRIYSGTRPAGLGALSGNTLLAELRMNATAFGSMSSGVMTAGSITPDSVADAAGIPTFARIFESDGTTLWGEVSVGKTGGSEELLINTTDGSGNPFIAAGGPVSIASLTVTFGLGT